MPECQVLRCGGGRRRRKHLERLVVECSRAIGSEIYDLLSVSCTSSNFCAAVDDNGGVDTWNGSSWTGPTAIDRGVQLDSVSCVSPSFCVAVDNSGNALTYDGDKLDGPG